MILALPKRNKLYLPPPTERGFWQPFVCSAKIPTFFQHGFVIYVFAIHYFCKSKTIYNFVLDIYRISDGNTTVIGKWIKKNTNE